MNMKPIPWFDGYMASDDGRIWTTKRRGGEGRKATNRGEPLEMKTYISDRGYRRVSLSLDSKVSVHAVHDLILMAFVGPRPPGMEACHYPDPSKENNSVSNLRWDTHAENIKDNYRDRPTLDSKTCSKCKAPKATREFYADKRASDRLGSQCKKCHVETSSATADPAKKRARKREWRQRQKAFRALRDEEAIPVANQPKATGQSAFSWR